MPSSTIKNQEASLNRTKNTSNSWTFIHNHHLVFPAFFSSSFSSAGRHHWQLPTIGRKTNLLGETGYRFFYPGFLALSNVGKWHEAVNKERGLFLHIELTLKVLVSTIDEQWKGMGDVGSARYEYTPEYTREYTPELGHKCWANLCIFFSR